MNRTLSYIFIALTLFGALRASALAPLKIPKSRAAKVGVVIRDLRTGKDIAAQNASTRLTPASILKCVTAASVLAAGMENDTFLTEVFFRGEQTDSIYTGDIIIAGSGDPTLESTRFEGNRGVADSINAVINRSGIKKICGEIICEADETGFLDEGPLPSWETGDLKWSYGAGLFAVNFSDNTYAGDRAIQNPGMAFKNSIVQQLASDSIILTSAPSGVDTRDFPEILMIQHYSPALKVILREMMEKSNNLYAEAMLRKLVPGASRSVALETEREVMQALGLNTANCIIHDGSGLTRDSKVTPLFMADLLQTMAQSSHAPLYTSLFPAAGVEGTVKRFLHGTRLEGNLVLKSGSMNGVQCFAGYKLDDDGIPTHAIVLMVNDFACKRAVVTKALSDYLLAAFPAA